MATKLTPRQRLEAVTIQIAKIEAERTALRTEESELERIREPTKAQSRRARTVDNRLAKLYAQLVELQHKQLRLSREVYGGY